jgi:hypothetical protein
MPLVLRLSEGLGLTVFACAVGQRADVLIGSVVQGVNALNFIAVQESNFSFQFLGRDL